MIKNIIIFFLSLVSFFSIVLNFNLYYTLNQLNQVVEIVDGDTFQLKSGKRVRLLGVDAPEYDRCGGAEAKERLKQLILNKIVSLKEEQQETFGQSLALVYQGKILVNEIILKEGWGRTDYRKNSQRERLTAAFHFAQQKRSASGVLSAAKPPMTNRLNDCTLPPPPVLLKVTLIKSPIKSFIISRAVNTTMK